jgi:signal transduction histidine kinase
MSHELRTPLNAIGGYTQLLELGVHGPLNAAQLNAVRRVEKNQAHLLTLINSVLNYAKLDSGMVHYRIGDVAIADAFRDMEPLIAPQVQAQRLQFLQYPPDRALTVKADRDKLHQILLNLLSNALKFTPAGGRITLSCSGGDDTISIHVRDTGTGVAPDRIETIFEPFFQGDRALSNPTDGVGLGLAISRDLARGMSGDLHVWSAPGVGSVFTVVLPRGSGERIE